MACTLEAPVLANYSPLRSSLQIPDWGRGEVVASGHGGGMPLANQLLGPSQKP